MMAQAEIEDGAKLFCRRADANTWGILNVSEEFLKDHPDIVRRVLATYEEARKYSLSHCDELKKTFVAVTRLPENVVDKQLKERVGPAAVRGDRHQPGATAIRLCSRIASGGC